MALIEPAEVASAWSFLCLPVERASLDHVSDPWRRVAGWLTFWPTISASEISAGSAS